MDIILIGAGDAQESISIVRACAKKGICVIVAERDALVSKPETLIITPGLAAIELIPYSPKIEKRKRLAETQTYKPWYKRK